MSILQFFNFILTNWFTNRYTIDTVIGFAGVKHFFKKTFNIFWPELRHRSQTTFSKYCLS
ncbi:hypothetical protein SAMN05428975_2802 [Mucilaginibacter sp. OK268]|nr:hypothetical protein SAMN05428975_2802 [Mucilaginibacter sp. OK268]